MTNYSDLASLIRSRQHELKIDDAELARSLGYPQPVAVDMIKRRTMRLPINKVSPLADALGIEAIVVLRLAMRESGSDPLDIIEPIINPLPLTSRKSTSSSTSAS